MPRGSHHICLDIMPPDQLPHNYPHTPVNFFCHDTHVPLCEIQIIISFENFQCQLMDPRKRTVVLVFQRVLEFLHKRANPFHFISARDQPIEDPFLIKVGPLGHVF